MLSSQRGRPWWKAHASTMLVILLLLFSANCFITTAADTTGVNDEEVAISSASASVDESPVAPDSSTSVISPVEPETGGPSVYPNQCNNNGTLTCEDNEILDKCPSYCPSDFCPTGDGQNQKCPQPNPCPRPTCKCRFNSRRAQNGTCIPTRDCPPFECTKPNEEYNSCPPFCPTDSCSQATPTGRCPLPGRIGIILECRPSCRCIKGYWRLNGTCVPYNQCPGKLTCGANEVVDNCPSVCKSDSCPTSASSSSDKEKTSCKEPCQCPPPACKCASNYLRASNGTCIPESQCPKELKCKPDEIVDTCPLFCNTDYCPKNDRDVRTCSIPFICPKPACKCPFNHLRAANGTCIPARSCPPIKCRRPHEVYNSCPPACPTDDCKDATPSGKCNRIGNIGIVVECRPGCRCKESYWRKNGTCVPFEQCGFDCQGPNEYYDCDGECDNVCKDLHIQSKNNCPIKNKKCFNKCYCKEGFARDAEGNCIPINECPGMKDDRCPFPNEVYKTCKKECPSDRCSSISEFCIPDDGCRPGCVCSSGFLRPANGKPCVPICECPNYKSFPFCQ